jgi:cysteinyl-tRNA synthetase
MGHAYVASGSEGHEVLFSTASMADYGMLSKRKLEDQQAGARVAVESHKMNPADFVLWKQSADTEPGWPAHFTFEGKQHTIFGRPGWHIECSAMADRYLWEEIKDRLSPAAKAKPHQFDIHGGGLDLIFPHHENEIAQSCCAFDNDLMATVWMHNGFLQVEGRKMSKSEGNFVTINELLATEKFGGRTWPGEVLRLAMLMTHYREPIDFSVKRLEEAQNIYNRWADLALGTSTSGFSTQLPDGNPLLDDLNTPLFISQMQGLYKQAKAGDEEARVSFKLGLQLLGFEQIEFQSQAVANLVDDDLSAAVQALVDMRLEMLKVKNFAEADKIRDDLAAKGIQLKDGKDKETGERVTTWEVKR